MLRHALRALLDTMAHSLQYRARNVDLDNFHYLDLSNATNVVTIPAVM